MPQLMNHRDMEVQEIPSVRPSQICSSTLFRNVEEENSAGSAEKEVPSSHPTLD